MGSFDAYLGLAGLVLGALTIIVGMAEVVRSVTRKNIGLYLYVGALTYLFFIHGFGGF